MTPQECCAKWCICRRWKESPDRDGVCRLEATWDMACSLDGRPDCPMLAEMREAFRAEANEQMRKALEGLRKWVSDHEVCDVGSYEEAAANMARNDMVSWTLDEIDAQLAKLEAGT